MRHCPPRLVCLFTVLALAGTTSVMANNEAIAEVWSAFARSKILLIGVFDSNMTIITKDASPLMYSVPKAKFANSQIDLYGVVPVELNSKWPALGSNVNFTSNLQNRRFLPQSIFIKLDNEKLIYAFNYGIKENVIMISLSLSVNPPTTSYQEYAIDDGFNLASATFISSTEQNVFFDLVNIQNTQAPLKLFKYVYQTGGFNISWSFYICKHTSDTIIINHSMTGWCNDTDWDIQTGGFVHQNHFHLFSYGTVYIFEFNGVGSASGVQVKAVKLSDFFVSLTPSTTTTTELIITTTKNGSGMIIAILSVALVLSVIVIIGLVVWSICAKQPDQALDSDAYRMGVSSQALGATATSGQDAIASKGKRSQSPSYKVKQTSKAKLAKLGKHKTKASSLKGTK